jgi:hypothetical protein
MLHNPTCFCQKHAFAYPLEEWDAEFLFEGVYVFADGRLTDVEHLSGGARETASADHRVEDLETVRNHLLL